MLVADLMTPKPASIRSSDTLAAAAQTMWDCDCGALPVLDPATDRVCGMITDRDICMATWSRGCGPGSIAVADVISPALVCCRPHDTLGKVEASMRSNQVRRIPVVDSEQRLVGILSLADVARATANQVLHSNGDEPSSDGLATTLAGICVRHAARSDVRVEQLGAERA
jgi:CBS domain-containing protein